jgi:hypothetical protein
MTAINKFTLMDEIPGAPASDNTICEYSGLMSVTSYMETKENTYTEEQVKELVSLIRTELVKNQYNHYSIDYDQLIKSIKQPKNDK